MACGVARSSLASKLWHRLPVRERGSHPGYRPPAWGHPAVGPAPARVAQIFPLAVVGPFLLRVASAGLVLALLTGFWLFSVKPREYVANPAFLIKLGLLAFALGNVALQHSGPRLRMALEREHAHASVRFLAALSMVLWLSILVAGRWIGFV